MGQRNGIRAAVHRFATDAGFVRASGSWYRRQAETVAVLNLQKSQYGSQYYLNLAFWLLGLGEAKYPKEHKCHVRTRLDELMSDREQARALTELMDLDFPIADEEREKKLLALLEAQVAPKLVATGTLRELTSDSRGRDLLAACLITGPAQELLRRSKHDDGSH